jgi:ankyrin repeat protein
MAGDLATVNLLLSHGAKADPSALSEAITFGNAEVVRALIAAGAPADVTDRTGVTLLHWATITDRPAVIPLLAAAGLDIDAQDDYGYTPLMYAASIDFGDTVLLQALLDAGADRSVEDYDGKTARQHARRLKHTHLEVPLR